MSAKAYLGPGLACSFAQAVETGIIIGQALTFWSLAEPSGDALRGPGDTSKLSAVLDNLPPVQAKSTIENERGQASSGSDFWTRLTWERMKKIPNERLILRFVVIYTIVLTFVQLVFTYSSVWRSLVVHWGHLEAALTSVWAARSTQMVNTLLAAPVQGFLIWRCWILTDHNKPLATFLLLLMLACWASAIAFTADVFEESGDATELQFNATFTVSIAFPAFLDGLLTIILCTYLVQSRRLVISRRFRRTLITLIGIIWEAALPPCICAIVTIISYFTSHTTFWFIFFQGILGQLYVISFFVTVNGFLSVRNKTAQDAGGDWVGSKEEKNHDNRRRKRRTGLQIIGVNVTVDVTQTVGPVDTLGESIALSLSNRLGLARAKSGNMRADDNDFVPPTPSTHKVKFSTSTAHGSLAIADRDTHEYIKMSSELLRRSDDKDVSGSTKVERRSQSRPFSRDTDDLD